jgi:hypothetical protein
VSDSIPPLPEAYDPADDLRNYTALEAAGILRCRVRFLEDNLAEFERQKMGISVAFDRADLLALKAKCRVRPDLASGLAAASSPPASLAAIRPTSRRRRAS